MVKSKYSTKPSMRKHKSLNSSAPRPEKLPIDHYSTAQKPVKTHKNCPNLEKQKKKSHPSAPKPVKTQKNNTKLEKPPKKYSSSAEKTPKGSSRTEKPQPWASFRNLISCKHLQTQPQPQQKQKQKGDENRDKRSNKMKCSGSLCNNTKVMQRPEPSSSGSSISVTNGGESSKSARSMKSPIRNGALVSSSSSSSFMVMPFRKFSGCYECRMVVDPVLGFTRDPSLRATICTCPQCGEIFMKAENLELHQAVRHAVSELGAEDTSKNIVEIIFQSSWLKKQAPVCKIDRILKVQNTPRTISKFEAYRDSIKAKSSSSTSSSHHHQRCLADGNELLRFHATSLLCSLGVNGTSNLCGSMPNCKVCSIIKNGFRKISDSRKGILTTATSGRADDNANVMEGEKRAMLVCRVIAGRVKKGYEDDEKAAIKEEEEYDSVAGEAGAYSNLDELYVFSPRAILPCFVVVYRGF